jgi:hypothetical protein
MGLKLRPIRAPNFNGSSIETSQILVAIQGASTIAMLG